MINRVMQQTNHHINIHSGKTLNSQTMITSLKQVRFCKIQTFPFYTKETQTFIAIENILKTFFISYTKN